MKNKAAVLLLLTLFFSAAYASWECPWEEGAEVKYEDSLFASLFEKETSPLKIHALGLLRLYHAFLSGKTGSECVFHPSCSRYTFFSISRYGTLKGSFMGADRLHRCNTFAYEDHYAHTPSGLLVDMPEYNDINSFIFDMFNF